MPAPKPQRGRNARIQRPRARIVGLVLVKTHDAAAEIHVAPTEPSGFLSPHPLPLKDPTKGALEWRRVRTLADGQICVRRPRRMV
jgi:hypothetical protein